MSLQQHAQRIDAKLLHFDGGVGTDHAKQAGNKHKGDRGRSLIAEPVEQKNQEEARQNG